MKFYIYRGVGSFGELTKIAEVTDAKTYTDTGLQPKTIIATLFQPTMVCEKALSLILSR